MKTIILAGGSGTRLWPLSREEYPKQFLSFDNKESLFQKTVARVKNVSNEIAIVTGKKFKTLIKKELKNDLFDILIEPVMRNTAPAIALGVVHFLEKGASHSDLCLVTPSDHIIHPEEPFFSDLKVGEKLATSGKIITFGVPPLRPETGFGYVKKGKEIDGAFDVEKFVEKPDLSKAKVYVENGFLWNAGIYLFSIETFLSTMKQLAPTIYSIMNQGMHQMLSYYEELPDISIDYALMEKTKNLCVVPLTSRWHDMGSWDQVYDFLAKDNDANAFLGNVVSRETKNCLVIGKKKLISTIGLEDFLVIETDEALLIAKRGESQKVKELVQFLRESL